MPVQEPRNGVALPFQIYPASTSESTIANAETIIWASIRHLCSRGVAEWVALKHDVHNKRTRSNIAHNLKLYVRQASEFYDAAGGAKPNTAPLIYYYSFLNLAKALCELRNPRFHEHQECYRHGLSWRPNPRRLVDLRTATVSVTTRGVWHVLWEALTRRNCPAANPTKINVLDLFSFCPEVNVEYDGVTGTRSRILELVSSSFMLDEASSEVWTRFSVSRSAMREFALSGPALGRLIQIARSGYREVRSANADQRVFESLNSAILMPNEVPISVLAEDVRAMNIFTHPGSGGKISFFIPLQSRLHVSMPQILVSYTILFWLGSLVRYDPHSVSSLMDSQYWMLSDGFMSQSRLWLLELFEWALYQAETVISSAR